LLGPGSGDTDRAGAEMIFTSGRRHALTETLLPFFGGQVPA
jgi:glutamate racemase